MLMSLAMMIAFFASLVLPVVGVVAVVTYVRRTKQLERMDGDGSLIATLLDSMEQVHVRLDAINARLKRMENSERLTRARSAAALQSGEGRASEPRQDDGGGG
jgi:hypothetical protein